MRKHSHLFFAIVTHMALLCLAAIASATLTGCTAGSKTEVVPGRSEVSSDYSNTRPRTVTEKTTRIRIIPKESKQ